MSILYWIIFRIINDFYPLGYFRWGRLVDLLQMDILIAVIWIYNSKRWNRLRRKDREILK